MAMRSTDRILKLEKHDPKQKDVGLIDPEVFSGGNNLHVVMDPHTLFWTFKYERGHVPPQLRNKFTEFKVAKNHAESYFKTKNIRIKEIID